MLESKINLGGFSNYEITRIQVWFVSLLIHKNRYWDFLIIFRDDIIWIDLWILYIVNVKYASELCLVYYENPLTQHISRTISKLKHWVPMKKKPLSWWYFAKRTSRRSNMYSLQFLNREHWWPCRSAQWRERSKDSESIKMTCMTINL